MEQVKKYSLDIATTAIYNPVFNWVGDHVPGFTPKEDGAVTRGTRAVVNGGASLINGGAKAANGVSRLITGRNITNDEVINMADLNWNVTRECLERKTILPPVLRRAKANTVFGTVGMIVSLLAQRWVGRKVSRALFAGFALVHFAPGAAVWAGVTAQNYQNKR